MFNRGMDHIRIEVTQAMLDGGRQRSITGCPVALAATAAGLEHPVVDTYTIQETAGIQRRGTPNWQLGFSWEFPQHVTEAIRAFDRGEKVEPFEFLAHRPR